jgi:predicted O-methyltransferase YrrM
MNEKKGILLDVGCRDRKEPNFIGIDSRERFGVDIIHDLESFPYPLEDESCLIIKCAHFVEHLSPKNFFPFMDEMWRLLKVDGQIAISVPYANSPNFLQDPTHTLGLTERSWQYLDPEFPMYQQYEPKPWTIQQNLVHWQVGGLIEIALRKREERNLNEYLAGKALKLGAMQKISELAKLFEVLRGYKMHTVVEIGTAAGGVLYGLCQLADEYATIVSIDLPGGRFGDGRPLPEMRDFNGYTRSRQALYLIRGNSHDDSTLKELKKHIKDPIDVLFIDGGHTYKDVLQDYEMYQPLVKKSGLIIFHDICVHSNIPECEVYKFWKKIKKGKKTFEIVDEHFPVWGGIGILINEGRKNAK